MRGYRQGVKAKLFASGVNDSLVTDKRYLLRRLRLYRVDGVAFVPADTIQLEVEGENIFGGLSVPIGLVSDPSDDATAAAGVLRGSNVITFDDPPEWSIQYPIRATLVGNGGASIWMCAEAVPLVTPAAVAK